MSRTVDMRTGAKYDVRIDRRTQWGNPFKLVNQDDEQERAEVLDEYRVWLWNEIRRGRWTLRELSELSGKTLGCWCAPRCCHGDVLGKAAEWAKQEIERQEAQR